MNGHIRNALLLANICLSQFGCGSDGQDGEPCTVVDNGGSATITCPDGSSTTITDGANGQNGTNGTNGADVQLASTMLCQGAIPSTPEVYRYRTATFKNDTTFVFGSIGGYDIAPGSSAYYPSSAAPFVSVTYDVVGTANAGWWSLQANIATKVVTITYNDADLGGTGIDTWVRPSSECARTDY